MVPTTAQRLASIARNLPYGQVLEVQTYMDGRPYRRARVIGADAHLLIVKVDGDRDTTRVHPDYVTML